MLLIITLEVYLDMYVIIQKAYYFALYHHSGLLRVLQMKSFCRKNATYPFVWVWDICTSSCWNFFFFYIKKICEAVDYNLIFDEWGIVQKTIIVLHYAFMMVSV